MGAKILLVPMGRIIPTNGIKGTNTELRCLAALTLWQANEYKLLITTGAICHRSEIQTKPGADILADWFIAQGVGREFITRTYSHDTYEDVTGALQILKTAIWLDNPLVTVVSGRAHCERFLVTSENYGHQFDIYPLDYPISRLEQILERLLLRYHRWDKKGTGLLARWNRARRTYR